MPRTSHRARKSPRKSRSPRKSWSRRKSQTRYRAAAASPIQFTATKCNTTSFKRTNGSCPGYKRTPDGFQLTPPVIDTIVRIPTDVFVTNYPLDMEKVKDYVAYRWELSWTTKQGNTKTVSIPHRDVFDIYEGRTRSYIVYERNGTAQYRRYLWLESVSMDDENKAAFDATLDTLRTKVAQYNDALSLLQSLRERLTAYEAPAEGFEGAKIVYDRDYDTEGEIAGWEPLTGNDKVSLFYALSEMKRGRLRLKHGIQEFVHGEKTSITLIPTSNINTEFATSILAGTPGYVALVKAEVERLRGMAEQAYNAEQSAREKQQRARDAQLAALLGKGEGSARE